MSPDNQDSLTADDLAAIASIARGNEWTRSVLCTLARRGLAVRRAEPERAAAIIDALVPWPWFKAGQFLFDLFEIEDFMVDGAPPEVSSSSFDAGSLNRLAKLLRQVRATIDSAAIEGLDALEGIDVTAVEPDPRWQELPELEPGFHLYRDVALGLFVSAGPFVDQDTA